MKDASDEERKRGLVAQRKVFLLSLTDDANKLIQNIKADRPDIWKQIVVTAEVGGVLSDEVSDFFVKTAREAFPERSLGAIGDLLERCVSIAFMELGRPDRNRQ